MNESGQTSAALSVDTTRTERRASGGRAGGPEPDAASPASQPVISPEAFKATLRQLAASVTVVTVQVDDRLHGLTVTAFSPISPDPPLVAVMIDSNHTAHELLERPGAVFAVNVLNHEQRELSDRFAWLKDGDRFAVGDWTTAVTGAPILADASLWLDCTVHDRMRAGTHTIYIGAIRAGRVPDPEMAPLLYWDRGYRRLEG